jgi:hypothetical protein
MPVPVSARHCKADSSRRSVTVACDGVAHWAKPQAESEAGSRMPAVRAPTPARSSSLQASADCRDSVSERTNPWLASRRSPASTCVESTLTNSRGDRGLRYLWPYHADNRRMCEPAPIRRPRSQPPVARAALSTSSRRFSQTLEFRGRTSPRERAGVRRRRLRSAATTREAR